MRRESTLFYGLDENMKAMKADENMKAEYIELIDFTLAPAVQDPRYVMTIHVRVCVLFDCLETYWDNIIGFW